jgi:hypothetical protein
VEVSVRGFFSVRGTFIAGSLPPPQFKRVTKPHKPGQSDLWVSVRRYRAVH